MKLNTAKNKPKKRGRELVIARRSPRHTPTSSSPSLPAPLANMTKDIDDHPLIEHQEDVGSHVAVVTSTYEAQSKEKRILRSNPPISFATLPDAQQNEDEVQECAATLVTWMGSSSSSQFDPKISRKGTKKRKIDETNVLMSKNTRKKAEMLSSHKQNHDERSFLRTRTSPSGLHQLVQCLNGQQRQGVKDIGFGGLLLLGTSKVPVLLSKWLAMNFDPSSCSLKLFRERLKITELDVHLTLGLPMGSKIVVEGETRRGDSDLYKILLEKWREKWGIQEGSPLLTAMPDKILSLSDGKDDFKRNFIIYVISSCINANQNGKVNTRVLLSLIDLDEVKNLNWCRYTLKSLVNAVLNWKAKPSRYFTGPNLFLMLCYLDRVVFRIRTVERFFPTLHGWTISEIKNREKAELEAGGFGRGSIDSCVDKNRVVTDSSLVVEDEKRCQQEKEEHKIAAGPISERSLASQRKAAILRASSVARRIIDDLDEWNQAIGTLKSLCPTSLAVERLQKTAANVFCAFATSSASAVELSILSQTQHVFEDPSFLEKIARIESDILKAKENLTKFPVVFTSPYTLGLIQGDEFNCVAEIQREIIEEESIETGALDMDDDDDATLVDGDGDGDGVGVGVSVGGDEDEGGGYGIGDVVKDVVDGANVANVAAYNGHAGDVVGACEDVKTIVPRKRKGKERKEQAVKIRKHAQRTRAKV